MTLTINTTFENNALPLDQSFKTRILALPGLQHWFQVDASAATLSDSKVSQLSDKAGTAAYLQQGTDAERGVFTNSLFGNYPGIVFDGVDDEYLAVDAAIDTNNDFTWAAIFRANVDGTSRQLLSNYQAANDGTWIGVNPDNNVRVRHGSGELTADYADAAMGVVVAGVSGGLLKMRLNGGATQSIATDNNGSAATLRVGRLNSGGAQPFAGSFSDVFLFDGDLFSDITQVNLIENFAARAYGVTLL